MASHNSLEKKINVKRRLEVFLGHNDCVHENHIFHRKTTFIENLEKDLWISRFREIQREKTYTSIWHLITFRGGRGSVNISDWSSKPHNCEFTLTKTSWWIVRQGQLLLWKCLQFSTKCSVLLFRFQTSGSAFFRNNVGMAVLCSMATVGVAKQVTNAPESSEHLNSIIADLKKLVLPFFCDVLSFF